MRPTSHLWCVFSATRQTHVGGEKIFVDFAGDTIDVIDPGTGEAHPMKLFVAVMGAPNYTYAEAVASEGWRTGSSPMPGCSPFWAACRRPWFPTI